MNTVSILKRSSANAGGGSVARKATYVFWCVVAIVAIYSVALLTLSMYGVHIIKGV